MKKLFLSVAILSLGILTASAQQETAGTDKPFRFSIGAIGALPTGDFKQTSTVAQWVWILNTLGIVIAGSILLIVLAAIVWIVQRKNPKRSNGRPRKCARELFKSVRKSKTSMRLKQSDGRCSKKQ